MIISWFNSLNNYRDRLRDWVLRNSRGVKAKWTLFIVSFTESSFFLIPPDIVLFAILMASPQNYIYYAGLTTIASVLGGLFGYFIGFFFFETVGEWIIGVYSLETEMAYVGKLYTDNAFWAVFISAFTPIPYKVFTISAGFFRIDLLVFIIASLLGRGLRFYLIGFLVKQFGPVVGKIIYRYFNITTLIFVILLIILTFYIFKF